LREFDIVVAGGGIAGLTAGLTAARLGHTTLVLTGDVLGGQLTSIDRIDGYPGFPDGIPGYDLCPMVQEQAAAAGAEMAFSNLDRLEADGVAWRITTGEEDIVARGVVLAMGADLRHLDVPGEEQLQGKGVSHCASCDAPLFRGKTAIVIGGGDSGLQEGLVLADQVGKVVLIERGPALTGQASYRDAFASRSNVETRFDTTVEAILGDAKVTGVRLTDANGTSDIEADAVFVYIGLQPNSAAVQGLAPLDASGHILTDPALRTTLPGLCAAGSIRAGAAGRATGSAGDGAAAVLTLSQYLKDGAWS